MLTVNGEPVQLKYLFVARFADGKIYQQSEQDVSVKDPERSCFFDVLEEEKTNPLTHFSITDGTKTWTVDLTTGSFHVGGEEVQLHDEDQPYHNRRLIFFRRRCLDMVSREELSCRYVIGWQANVAPETDSKCDKFVMYIK